MEIKVIGGVEFRVMPREFGDGWATKSASDYMRMMIIAGFDPKELILTVSKIQKRKGSLVSIPTVERAAGIIQEKYRKQKEEE